MNFYDINQKVMNSMTMNINKNRKNHTARMTFMNNRLSFYQWDIITIFDCRFNFSTIRVLHYHYWRQAFIDIKSEFIGIKGKETSSAGERCSFFGGWG